ncbi:hypothetical protein J5N97_022399 [Dioscorea zingiberensis]|uniref:Myb/SANT-like domain-containing protein n=1 Tax=Dioscorea zingiberensis TaxID=325984 RepID=A0A9D5CBG5_9LILI|nr:hypothetical protein J5N97_022399 [Dioscorea zingiberensis]
MTLSKAGQAALPGGSSSLIDPPPSQQDVHQQQQRNNCSTEGDETLIYLLLEEQLRCKRFVGSSKSDLWFQVWNLYQQKTNEDISMIQLKNRWKILKKKYKIYSSLLNKSGWSWDFENDCPSPKNLDMWDDIIKVNKEYENTGDKSFPLFWLVHEFACDSAAIWRFDMRSTKDKAAIDVGDGSGSSDAPDGEQPIEVHPSQRKGKNIIDNGLKRKQLQNQSIPVMKRKNINEALVEINRLVELSDNKSKIIEQYKDEIHNLSFRLCMDKLTSLSNITDEKLFVGAQALKNLDERIFFLTMQTSAIDVWLSQHMKKFHNQG